MAGVEGRCRACGAQMLWAGMPSGRLNPLNIEEVPAEVKSGVIAFNPATGRGLAVTYAGIDRCAAWAEQGVTFHTSHFATCPEREQFGKPEHATRKESTVGGS